MSRRQSQTAIQLPLLANTLKSVKQQLTTYFCGKDMLVHQQSYMRYSMVKPANKSIRKFFYADTMLNNALAKLPPLFNASQKLPTLEFVYAVHQNAAKSY